MKRLFYLLVFIFTSFLIYYFTMEWLQLPAGERYIYVLDDVYIHLALAKNVAESGVWSINTSGFDSASSSILYTLLLSGCMKAFGNWEYYPLIINIVFGYLTVYGFYRYFKDFYGVAEFKWGLLLIFPFTMLYYMVLIGMEHTIHLFLMVMAVYFIHKNSDFNFNNKNHFLLLCVTVFFLASIRFESMFFTASLAFALLLNKKFLQAAVIVLTGAAPIVAFGIFSLLKGGFFFPNSVLIKGSFPGAKSLFLNLWQMFRDGILFNLSFYKCLFFPFLLCLLYLLKKYSKSTFKKFTSQETLMITVVSTGILHSLFSVLKYRYENYLMITVLMLVAPLISKVFKKKYLQNNLYKFANIACVLCIVAVAAYRLGFHHKALIFASKGIHDQQVEMSRFLLENYRGEKIVANDIGAISYFSQVTLLDIVGLGSTPVTKIKFENKHQPPEIIEDRDRQFLIQTVEKSKYRIAVIYPEWFPGKIPASWIPVASWTLREPFYGPVKNEVVYYAFSVEEAALLKEKLFKYDLNKNTVLTFY